MGKLIRESMEGLIGPVRSFAAVAALKGPKNKTHILWITIISIFVIVPGIMRQVIQSINDNKGIIIAAVEFANYNSRMPTTICCLIMTNLRAGYLTDFITSARTLDKKFTNMGFLVDYEVVKRSGPSLVGLVLFKLALQQIPFLSQGFSWDLIDYLDYIIYNIPIFIIHVLLIQWIVYLTILRLHFKTLSIIVKTLRYHHCWVSEDFRVRRSTLKMFNRQREVVRTCSTIYDELCKQSERINDAFAWQILFLIPTLFVLVIFNSFQSCRMIKNLVEFDCGSVIFDILYFGVFLELVTPCIALRQEVDKFVNVLHRITTNEIDEEVSSLILQTCHQKIEFSACGVFTLDGTLIYTINVFVVFFTIVVSALAAVYPAENVAEASEFRPKRDHHQGVTGPVHTYVKTDKHANFKWGVKHHVGHHYAGRR
ncbi:hypothetical protein GEV33_010060 [Tenebrio molitor]|uniref:Gustatory receptor n=1 Tax=Tenebrio molitor TaxID=7067 RepID=A0A8J6HEN1_TENMO|nr:hypothetical protein GEV33_010060 [Tenebrio molitor]